MRGDEENSMHEEERISMMSMDNRRGIMYCGKGDVMILTSQRS